MYKLVRDLEFNENEWKQLVGAFIGHGYVEGVTNNPLNKSYSFGNSNATLGPKSVTLSFDPNSGRDKEYFEILLGVQQITGVRQVLVNNRTELRILQSAGIEARLEEDKKPVRFPLLV